MLNKKFLFRFFFILLFFFGGISFSFILSAQIAEAGHQWNCEEFYHFDSLCALPAEGGTNTLCSTSDITGACALDVVSGFYLKTDCSPSISCGHVAAAFTVETSADPPNPAVGASVDVTIIVASGSATPSNTFELDCDNDADFEWRSFVNVSSWTFYDACSYITAGPKTIVGRLTDFNLARHSHATVVNVGPAPVQPVEDPPTADFTVPLISNLSVQFADTSATGINPIVSRLWTFGDNTAPQLNPGISVIHVYQYPGEYEVRLIVIDTKGLFDIKEERIKLIKDTSPPNVPSNPIKRLLRSPLNCASISDCLNAFINFILILSTPLLILLIIYAAIMIMIGGASPTQRATAINTLRFALIGYIIILLAKVILGVVTGVLF